MHAYVYLMVQPGRVEQVLSELDGRAGIRRAVAMTGTWDVIVALHQHESIGAIAETVFTQIHGISGIERTVTRPVAPLEKIKGSDRIPWPKPPPVPLHRAVPGFYVHVEVAVAAIVDVITGLLGVEGVAAVAPLLGDTDLLVELSSETVEDAVAVVVDGIGDVDGVAGTSTMISLASVGELEEVGA